MSGGKVVGRFIEKERERERGLKNEIGQSGRSLIESCH